MTSPHGRKVRFLLRVERFCREHWRLVFLLALLALLAGSWLGSKLSIESDILALIPKGNRQVDAFRKGIDQFGSIDYLIVLLEAGPDEDVDDLEGFADAFAGELRALDGMVDSVEYRFQPDADFLELFYENALLFLPPDRLPELREKLSDAAIERQVEENRLLLASPAAAFVEELVVLDPLRLLPLFLNRLLGNRGVMHVDLSDGYYLSPDQRALIMLVKPSQPWQDLEFDERLLAAVTEVESRTRESLDVDIQTSFTGHYAFAVSESRLVRQDVRFNLITSLIAVSALYWLCYRRFAALLYTTLPLLVGQALTFGLAFFVLRSLNAASSAFTALLMGLGTDFVIVMYARYVEERRDGRGLAEATERMVGETGLGVFTGAITSAGTFYAMCITEFRGLYDLGFLIGSGILVCAVAIVCMVPAMIAWNEGVRPRRVDALKKLHVQSFFLERLIGFSARHRAAVIVTVALLSLAGGWLALGIEFDDSIQVLRSTNSAAYRTQQQVANRFGGSPSYMMALAEAPTEQEALALAERIDTRLRPFLASGVVSSRDSILTYLPPESQQQAVLDALRADAAGAFAAPRVAASFARGLEASGFNPEAFADFSGRLGRFLGPTQPIGLADLQSRGLGRLVDRYVRHEGDHVRIVTYLFLSDPQWKRRPPPGLVEALSEGDPGIVVTGTNVVGMEFRRIFSHEAPRAVLLGFAVVFVLLWLDFRSLRLTGIALAQLVSGVLMMLGAMRLLGLQLNYVNAFVATMILGVGIDYAIHLIHRLQHGGGRLEPGLLETGKAVVLAALTNIAGFGTLIFGNYPALRSFGKLAVLGSIACMLTALTLVPACMARPERK